MQNKGIVWNISEPFQSTFVFLEKGTIQIVDGKKEFISAEQRPFHDRIAGIFTSLNTGEITTLSQYYKIFFTGQETNWQIGLKAKEDTLKKATDEIILTGGLHIKNITIKDKHSSIMSFQFSSIQTSANLSTEEKNYFEI